MNNTFDSFSSGLRWDELQASTLQCGLTLAKVTNINDPDKLNRVLCRPIADEAVKDILETEWCPVMQPLSGSGCGQYFMPSVDDLVLISFLNGDPHCPYVVGGTWNQDSPAPYTLEEAKNVNFSVKTPGGSELLFYDEKGKESIKLNTPSGASLTMNDEQQCAELKDSGGSNHIKMDWKGGEITIESAQKITFKVGSAQITMESSGAITIDAGSGDLTMKAANVNATATNAVKLKGASANVEADGKLTLKGASADLKGPAGVNIN